jgi:hypothetical protein
MRAHITIMSPRSRRSARTRVLVLAISVCALAIPASAGAKVYTTSGGSSDSSQPVDTQNYSSVNAIAPASDTGSRTGTELGQAVEEPSGPNGFDSGHSSLNAIAGSLRATPTAVSSSPSDTGDGFDWGDAALGAGAALSLAALAGAALFTARRRTTVSPA